MFICNLNIVFVTDLRNLNIIYECKGFNIKFNVCLVAANAIYKITLKCYYFIISFLFTDMRRINSPIFNLIKVLYYYKEKMQKNAEYCYNLKQLF